MATVLHVEKALHPIRAGFSLLVYGLVHTRASIRAVARTLRLVWINPRVTFEVAGSLWWLMWQVVDGSQCDGLHAVDIAGEHPRVECSQYLA